ncbi:MAG: alpha/beta hydrolase [Bacteroidota bacterium]
MQRSRRWGLAIVLILTLTAFMVQYLQEKLIFLPTQLPKSYEFSFSVPHEELFLESTDGALLNALHFKTEKARGTVLYFHGNAGDLSRWGEIAAFFVKLRFNVIVMDYRTYGKSTGKLSETALYADAQLFYEYTKKHCDEHEIVIYGRSLGCSIATHLASKNKPRQLILETPFYNLQDVAQQRFPFLPVKALLRYKMESDRYIQNVTCPITIFHGTDDSVVPYDSGKRLFESIPKGQKKFYTIIGGEHNNLVQFEAYLDGIREVLLVE